MAKKKDLWPRVVQATISMLEDPEIVISNLKKNKLLIKNKDGWWWNIGFNSWHKVEFKSQHEFNKAVKETLGKDKV